MRKLLERWQPQIKLNDKELEHYLLLFEQLPGWRQQAIVRVALFGLGLCSKCRWASGCSQCDPMKALRYHLSKERMVPKAKGVMDLNEGSAGAQSGGGSDDLSVHIHQAMCFFHRTA